jgi:hypothetical protein
MDVGNGLLGHGWRRAMRDIGAVFSGSMIRRKDWKTVAKKAFDPDAVYKK